MTPGAIELTIGQIIRRIPDLTASGIGIDNPAPDPFARARQFAQQQKSLLEGHEAFQFAFNWIAHIDASPTINHKYSSYDLTLIVHESYGHTTNGALIAAAIHKGFAFERILDTPHVHFNMCKASIKRMSRFMDTSPPARFGLH
ncbi:hypothetical protein V5738_01000 [Salinisphaera sp. SPP-AMP-43]|uniref:hypothetical protein n=1 Tax=Salinisphaera sp. SPP-AMP-43 TaxID=3121288 RepID=UPI003C6DF86F